ncbi:MAG: hypothetical protein O7B26_07575, partial [Planctomycetota bacterium]|nr:hypothetical protein [Planctomycetota bacterium]
QSLAEREGRREDQARELSRRQEQLAEDQAALAAEREAVSRERTERGQRETEMSQLCASLERKQGELDRREKEVSAMRKEWDQKMQGLESAQASLAELQRQLKQELNKTVDTKNELLPVFGLNGESDQDGKPNNGEIPKPLQKQARESVKRFQKLCRDARRRAIGN